MKALFLLNVVLWLPFLVSAQHNSDIDYHCVENQQLQIDRILENKQALKNGIAVPREEINVPIKFHLVADSDGLSRVDVNDVLEQLCTLNMEFADTDFRFYIDNGFNLIDSDAVFNTPTQGVAVAEMLRAKRDEGPEAINIFLTESARETDVGVILGFYANVNDWIVILESVVGTNNKALSHELGHYFSLAHPHFGWDRQPWDQAIHGNPVLITRTDGVRVELVDGSNCDEAGDFICDTPPDYNFGFGWSRQCPDFNLDVMDRNLDVIDPLQPNFMSYFFGCDQITFTPGQNEMMLADYMSSRREHIRTGFNPITTEIPNTLELISPENNTTTKFFDGVELTWTTVENASQYLVVLRSGLDEIIEIVEGTSVFITDLLPDEIYTWSVTPFNDGYTCAGKETNILRTNNITTNTEDPDFAETIRVQPNPVNIGDAVTLHIETNEALEATLSIFSIEGKAIWSEKSSIGLGKNNIKLQTNEFQSGVYMLSLSTSKGTINRKLIISN